MDEILLEKLLHSFPASTYIDIVQQYDAGRSGMPVFAVEFRSHASSGLNGTYVVKIGPHTWATTEERLYSNSSTIPLTSLLAPLRKCSRTVQDLKAVAYDVAFNDIISTRTLGSLIDKGGKSAYEAQRQIQQLSHALVDWNIATASSNRRVYGSYALLCLMLGRRIQGMQQKFKTYLPFWGQETFYVRVDGLTRSLPNPLAYLRENAWNRIGTKWPCPIGQVHGDLHTGNIICLPGNRDGPKVIDFGQYQPERVPFFDLAYLEFDAIQHALPLEREENREQWLDLLDFSMVEVLPADQPQGYQADRAWMLIRPIREQAERLRQVNNGRHQKVYEIAWWMSTVAVGLNFANKGNVERPPLECVSALLYAAYGLERLLKTLELKVLVDEHPPLILWVQGKLPQAPSQLQSPLESPQPLTQERVVEVPPGDEPSLKREDQPTELELQKEPSISPLSKPSKSAGSRHRVGKTYRDWGDAPNINVFFGRKEELAKLEQWILKERCRLVAIVGMAGIGKSRLTVKLGKGGIGKTDLSIKLARGIQNRFEYVVWRRLLNAPKAADTLADLIKFFSNQQEIDIPDTPDGRITRLLFYLRQHRCLLIFDNVETILQGGIHAGQYLEGYEEYGQLFKKAAEVPHQSCLLLTTREKPNEIAILEGQILPVRSLELGGLDYLNSKSIFATVGSFSASEEEWKDLNDLYNGNPLALELAARHIKEVFFEDIPAFLRERKQMFADLRDLLDWYFTRLDGFEKEVMCWLAVNRVPTSLVELREDILSPVAKEHVSSTLQLLQRLVPLEKSNNRFSLQPVLIEYMTERLVEQAVEEIKIGKLNLLNAHALLKALANDYVRDIQSLLILKPIGERLLAIFGNQARLETQLKELLFALREETPLMPGYAGGNILNILCQLGVNIKDYDFSYLTIWQAYLQGVNLQDVNFSHSDLLKTIFSETFGGILSIAFSSDGEMLAAGIASNEIRVWQIKTGRPLLICQGHTNWVHAVAFNPTGKMIASGSDDHTVRLWDVQTGQCLKTVHGHTNRVWSLAFSPDGSMLASSSDDHTVRLWNVQTGECLRTLLHDDRIWSVAFSPDGSMLASSSHDHILRLWDIQTGECLRTFQGHTNWIDSVAFSPDGSMLASSSHDHTVRLWDIQTGECLRTFQGHTNWVRSVAFSPDGSMLASGGDDQTVRLWDVQTSKCLNTLLGHSNRVRSIAFSPNGSIVASGSDDHRIRLWDVQYGQCLKTLHGHTNWIWSVAFSSDKNVVVSGGEDQRIRLWNIQTGQCIKTFIGHTNRVRSVDFNPDGSIVASCSEDQTVRLWDVRTGRYLKILHGHTNWIRSVAFSSDGHTVASGSDDHTVKLWEVITGQCLKTFLGHTNRVWAVAFSPNGDLLASGGEDQTVRLWNVQTGECLKILQGENNWIDAVDFSPDGSMVTSGGDDRTVRLWDVQTGECLKTFQGHTNWVRSVAFSPDGSIVASGGDDQVVRLWDVQSGEHLKILHGHTNWIRSVAFSPDGSMVASGSDDGTVRIWNVLEGQQLTTLTSDRPYERMNITRATGLTDGQKNTLKVLGAIEDL